MKMTIKNCRLAFPAIFEAKAVNPGDTPAFSAALLIGKDHPQLAEIKKAIGTVGADKWKDKAPAILKQLEAGGKTALHDGDTKASYDGFEGNLFISARNQSKPAVKDRDGKTDLTRADGRPYGGCYVNAVVEFWAQDNNYGKRVNATLLGVQFVRDGAAFAGGTTASDDDFEDLSAGEADSLM